MEFNIFDHFKGMGITSGEPTNHYEQGANYFSSGHLGARVRDRLDTFAERVNMPRRSFMKTVCGFTGAMLAVNQATGMRFFDVSEAEAMEQDAAHEKNALLKSHLNYVVDQHTHICWREDGFVGGVNTSEKGMWFVNLLDGLGKAMGLEKGIEDMTVENYGKLILDESDTTVGIFNPFGFREDYGDKDMIPIEEQVEVRNRWPNRTIMMGGGLTPNQGLEYTLDRLTMFVEDYQISGLKLYTFDSTPQRGWWFDDVKLAYPIWEKCRELGIKNVGCHKGIPFGQFMARYAHAEDFDAVADDFMDMNWIAFHSAWPYHSELAALKSFKPQRNNLFCELGSTFAATVTSRPLDCAHVLGTLLRDLGQDSVLWGTDSVLWGNPQWQIEAFRRFRIPDELIEGYGYPQLTDELKAKVLGTNAARLWGLETASNTPPAEPSRIVAA